MKSYEYWGPTIKAFRRAIYSRKFPEELVSKVQDHVMVDGGTLAKEWLQAERSMLLEQESDREMIGYVCGDRRLSSIYPCKALR